MSNYILAYHGGKKPEIPAEGAKNMAKWKAWVGGTLEVAEVMEMK